MIEYLESLVLTRQIRKALEEVHNDKLLPVFIPSYKNRSFTTIPELYKIPGIVYLFIYEDDRDNYPKKFPDNVNLHIIKKEDFERMNLPWHTIAGKREYMLEYAKNNNFHKVIVIDDDINFEAYISSKENKYKKADIWDCFKLITRLSEPYGYGIAGFSDSRDSYDWKNIVNFNRSPVASIILNIDNLKEKDIHYQTDCNGLIQEDRGIIIDCNANKLKTLVYDFICFFCNEKWGGKHSLASSKDIINILPMNYYAHYRDYSYLTYEEDKLNAEINFENIKKGIFIIQENEELYKACKDNNLEKVKELLSKNVNKKFEEW